MSITVKLEKQEEISIIGAGLWLSGRIQYFQYILWSSTWRGQRLRAHFFKNCFPVAAYDPSRYIFIFLHSRGLRKGAGFDDKGKICRYSWLALFASALAVFEPITARCVRSDEAAETECHAAQLSDSQACTASMHKHHHCCKCPECYEVTRMAALRRMDAPSYGGDWQAEPYGYPPAYGGGQTLPPPASGGGGSMGGGGGTLGRSKGKILSAGGPGGPNPKGQSKGGPKVNGNNSSGQGGWWPECTCTNREWYDQVTHCLYCWRAWAGVTVIKLMH